MLIPSSLLQALNLESFATVMPLLNETGNSKKKIWKGGLADVQQLKTDMKNKCVILECTPKYSQNKKKFWGTMKGIIKASKNSSFFRYACDFVFSNKTLKSNWPIFLSENTHKKNQCMGNILLIFSSSRFTFLRFNFIFPIFLRLFQGWF